MRGTALALNATDVFYGTWEEQRVDSTIQLFFAIRTVAKTGGPSRLVAYSPDVVVAIAANDHWVYWTTSSGGPNTGLYRAPAGGGATELVIPGFHFSQIAIDDEAAYVAHFPYVVGEGTGSGTVYAVAHTDATPVAIQTGVTMWGWQSGLAADSSHVYYVDDPPPANSDGTHDSAYVKRVAKRGGVAETVFTCVDEWPCGWFSLALDDRNLYLRDRAGELYARSKDGRTAAALTSPMLGQDLDVSGGVMCWNVPWSGPRSDPNPYPVPGIRCGNTDGTGVHEIDTGVVYGWSGPRVDDRYVYYVRGSSLVRHQR